MPSDVRAVTWRLETVGITSARAVSSWKCVANRQNDPILVAMYLREKTVFSAHTRIPNAAGGMWLTLRWPRQAQTHRMLKCPFPAHQ